MLRICIVDDEVEHLQRIQALLLKVLPVVSRESGATITEKSVKIDTCDNALDVIKMIDDWRQNGGIFPYDVLIADVFMPMDPDSDREHPYGGAVRIYDAVKNAKLQSQLILLIVSKDVEGAEDALAKINAEQRELESQWAFVFAKPGGLSALPSDVAVGSNAWTSVVAQVIAHRNDQEWRKRNFLRLPAQEIISKSYFDSARMELEAISARSTCPFILITGERGTGKEILAKYLAKRRGNSDQIIPLTLRAGAEKALEVRLFGRELPDPVEGVLERHPKGIIFIDNFALRSEQRRDLDIRLLELLKSMCSPPSVGQCAEGEFYRVDGVDAKRFSGAIVLSCESIRDLTKNPDISQELVALISQFHVHLPPLRDVPDSILPLARHYLASSGKSQQFEADAIRLLKAYNWPENIKELEERITAVAGSVNGTWITVQDLRKGGITENVGTSISVRRFGKRFAAIPAVMGRYLIKLMRLVKRLWDKNLVWRVVVALVGIAISAVIALIIQLIVEPLISDKLARLSSWLSQLHVFRVEGDAGRAAPHID